MGSSASSLSSVSDAGEEESESVAAMAAELETLKKEVGELRISDTQHLALQAGLMAERMELRAS